MTIPVLSWGRRMMAVLLGMSVLGCSSQSTTPPEEPVKVEPALPLKGTTEASPPDPVTDPDDGDDEESGDYVDSPEEIDQAIVSAEKNRAQANDAADAILSEELQKAEIPMEINAAVREWIDYFTVKDRDRFQRFMERGERYKPMVMAALRDQGIPTELFYQAMIESGFTVHATSSAKAVGIWQFIKGTGRRYGLRIDNYVDERRDPMRSTIAAALYLKDLHNVFQSWYLALAAYNAGEGRILNAIMGGKTRDFWQLARDRKLPAETMHYIPKFIAAVIIGHNPRRYGIEDLPPSTVPDLVSVAVPSPVKLSDVADSAGVSLDLLKDLNPHILRGVTPPGATSYRVWVPKERGEQLEKDWTRLASLTVRGLPAERVAARSEKAAGGMVHTVARGETLGKIAARYGMSVKQLVALNKIKGRRVSVGTKLVVATSGGKRDRSRTMAAASTAVLSYKVRRGDNLDKVARRFGMTVGEIKRINRLRRNRLEVGQVLSLSSDRS